MILFVLICYFAYDRAIHHKKLEEKKLRMKLDLLSSNKIEALDRQEELNRQIASQNDEAFIELTLMRRLGLVPEGQKKVHFITTP